MTSSSKHERNRVEALFELFEGLSLNKPGKELEENVKSVKKT